MTNITFTKCLGEQMKNEDIKTYAKINILIMGLQGFLSFFLSFFFFFKNTKFYIS